MPLILLLYYPSTPLLHELHLPILVYGTLISHDGNRDERFVAA